MFECLLIAGQLTFHAVHIPDNGVTLTGRQYEVFAPMDDLMISRSNDFSRNSVDLVIETKSGSVVTMVALYGENYSDFVIYDWYADCLETGKVDQ